jgi:hypothetical protein
LVSKFATSTIIIIKTLNIYISPNVLISGRTGVKPENFYLRFFFGGGNF